MFENLNIAIKNIDKASIYSIIGPLYKLRQACVHPQVILFHIKLKLIDIYIEIYTYTF